MASTIPQIPGIPDCAKEMMDQLLREELIPLGTLKMGVESYRKVIHEARRKNGVANTEVGDQVAFALTTMLNRVNASTGHANLLILQAAVRYFVIQDDGTNGHDLMSEDGLNDDAQVVNAVLHYFGRDDLKITGLIEPAPARGRAGRR